MNFNGFYKFSCVFLLAFLSLAYADSPYAVRKVGTTSGGAEIGEYGYDTANNRLTKTPAGATNPTQTITMDLTTKPATITTEWGTDSILQGIGGKRYLRVHADGRKRFYLQGMEYRIDDDGASSVVYIRANGYSPDVQVTLSGSGTPQYTYLLKDHLGSPLRTVDDTGALTSAARYDPWGQQVAAIGVATNYDSVQNIENAENVRGYTGHELIATANMGHFNGRIFDYEGGGFAGPDKYIQGRSIASLNRFALGHNNNPNVTDPTGWARIINNTGLGERVLNRLVGSAGHHNTTALETSVFEGTRGAPDVELIRENRITGRNFITRSSKDYFIFRIPGTPPGEDLVRIQTRNRSNPGYVSRKFEQLNARLRELYPETVHPEPAHQQITPAEAARLRALAQINAAAQNTMDVFAGDLISVGSGTEELKEALDDLREAGWDREVVATNTARAARAAARAAEFRQQHLARIDETNRRLWGEGWRVDSNGTMTRRVPTDPDYSSEYPGIREN